MKYFLHDTSASDDEKITELFIEFGYEGIGLFYTVLEKIGKQEKPIKTSILKAQLKVGKRLEKCWQFMEEIGIICSNNGETFNERILSYNEMYQIKKEKNKERISEWRKNQEYKKNVTSYKSVRNAPKEKVLKEKVYKENTNTPEQIPALISPEFEMFLKWSKETAPNILKMKEPFTEIQFFEIHKSHPAAKIEETLLAMHNWKPLLSKNTSAFLTAKNWLKPKQNGTSTNRQINGSSSKSAGAERLLDSLKNDINLFDGPGFAGD